MAAEYSSEQVFNPSAAITFTAKSIGAPNFAHVVKSLISVTAEFWSGVIWSRTAYARVWDSDVELATIFGWDQPNVSDSTWISSHSR